MAKALVRGWPTLPAFSMVLLLAVAHMVLSHSDRMGDYARSLDFVIKPSEFCADIPTCSCTDRSKPMTATLIFDHDDERPRIVHRRAKRNTLAWASFNNTMMTNGWATLELHTNSSVSDDNLLADAAGFLEGYLTAPMIWDAYRNLIRDYCNNSESFCTRLFGYLSSTLTWAEDQCELAYRSGHGRPYWRQYRLIMRQLLAMVKGYNTVAPLLGAKRLHFGDFMLMSIDGDLITLKKLLAPVQQQTAEKLGQTSCSALVKLTPSMDEVFFGHTSWENYNRMLRIYKLYDLHFTVDGSNERSNRRRLIPGHRVGFASYPMNLQSNDDFYTIGSGLAVMETTIENENSKRLRSITPRSMLYFFRVQIANRLATCSQEWTELFSRHNSGTYNNQMMVFDYKRFKPGQRLPPGTFRVLEQLPGYIHTEDMTEFLNMFGYWPSYNMPFFPEVYLRGNFSAQVKQYKDLAVYERTPRALIFHRDQGKAVDLKSVYQLLRYNDFKHDNISLCSPLPCNPPYSASFALAARGDLNPSNGTFPQLHAMHGAVDCKITSRAMMKQLQAYIAAGPTHEQQPVFRWSTSGKPKPHGQPDAFDFQPFFVKWKA